MKLYYLLITVSNLYFKAQRGCKSVLSAFGVREPEEKGNAEFFWSTAPAAHNRNDYEHTLRPVGETMVPDCVQMTYANSQSGKTSYTTSHGHSDNSTMQLHPGVHDHGRVHDTRMRADQYPATHQYMVAADSSRTNFGTCPTRQYPMGPGGNSQSSGSNYNGSIYNPNHSVIQNPSLPRMGYADFRPTNGEFEFHQNNYGPPQPAAQRRPLLHQHNGDVEV